MRNLNLNNYGVQEMNAVEMKETDGGKVEYIDYQWHDTDNELVYAMEAVENGGIAVANGAIWLWNHL